MSKYSVIKKGDDTELAIKGFPSSGKVTERRMVNGSLFIKTDMTKQWPQGFIPVELVNPLFTAPSSAMVLVMPTFRVINAFIPSFFTSVPSLAQT